MYQKSAMIAISHFIVNGEKPYILYDKFHGGWSVMLEELVINSNSNEKLSETLSLDI